MINIEHTIDDIEVVPLNLYKYYKFDANYNKRRLTGEVYFSSPLKFNDPLDSQLDVKNNTKDFSEEWLSDKLFELGYNTSEIISKIIELRSAHGIEAVVTEVHKKQLEKLGILCLSENNINPIMWSYYTNNEGYCIEYDTTNLLQDIVVDFVDKIS